MRRNERRRKRERERDGTEEICRGREERKERVRKECSRKKVMEEEEGEGRRDGGEW